MNRDVSNTADIIDSRDIIERIKELEDELDTLELTMNDADEKVVSLINDVADLEKELKSDDHTDPDYTNINKVEDELDTARIELSDAEYDIEIWNDDYKEELDNLKKLAEECEGYSSDWKYGETLIRDSYFVEYAEQLADDIGAIDNNAKWPLNHIDWEAAAEELQYDYTMIDYDGINYWIRSS